MSSGNFASADFLDAEDSRPIEAYYDIGAGNSQAPFTNAITNVISRHVYEIQTSTTATPVPPVQWKKRLRTFLLGNANDIFEFATKTLATHPTLGPAELLISKFSRGNFQPNHASLRDIVLDASGVDFHAEINADLAKYESSLKGFSEQTQYLYNAYRISGDAILNENMRLQTKLDVFDKIQKKIVGIADLQVNEFYEPLAIATENYLEKIFKENGIEENYKTLIQAYKKFYILRDVIHLRRAADSITAEPLCSICFEKTIEYVLSPCGHTYCGGCIMKQTQQCFICRQTVRERVKMFLG